MFCLETFILDYWEKTQIKSQQLFEVIIDITSFYGVEGLDFIDIFKLDCIFYWNRP